MTHQIIKTQNFLHGNETHYVPGAYVNVNGTQLWVEQEGKGEPLLLLHGGPASSHLTFHPHFSALADTFCVIYLDYRGRGLSGAVKNLASITFESDVADVAALIETLDYGPINVYGFSYGGMIAQALALEHPHLVKRLVLANTLHSSEMWQRNHENINHELERQFPEIWDQILELRAAGYRSSSPEMRVLFAKHRPLVRFYNPDHATKLLSDRWSHNDELYFAFAGEDIEFFIGGEVARLPDFRARLKELTLPLLVIAGRYDRALYPRYQFEFKRFAPRAEFVMLERSGSFAHLEETETLMTMLREFYHQQPSNEQQ